MSTTFGQLKNRVSVNLQDPSQLTFTEPLVEELVQSALVEVGRIAPEQFTEDLTPVENQLSYTPRADAFSAVTLTGLTGQNSDDLFDSVAHGLQDAQAVTFTSLTGGSGLSLTTTYYVVSSEDDTFQLATSVGGTAVSFGSDVTDATLQLVGTGDAVPELEVMRVEVWDPTQDPEQFIYRVNPATSEYSRGQDSGWVLWGGTLTLPTRVVRGLQGYEDTYVIRIWGYSPYVHPVADSDVIAISKEAEQAMLWHCRFEALEMMLASRDLFSQWQTRSGNSDMSPAALQNQKSVAEAAWQRRARSIGRLRSEV